MIAWFARNGVAANLLMAVIIGLGLNATFTRIPMEIFPAIERDIITIVAVYRGATPAEVEKGATIRIEEAIADLEGIDKVESESVEGAANIIIELLDGYNPRDLLDDMKGRVDGISTFPDGVEEPILNVMQRRKEVISVVLSGDLTEHALRRLSEEVRSDLTALPGITQVELSGVRKYEIAIEVSESTLQRYHLTLDDIALAIGKSSQDVPAGSIKTEGGEVLLRSLGQAYRGEDFADIVIVTQEDGSRVTLGEIADIRDGFEEEPLYALFDGKSSAELDVYRVGTQSAIEVADKVKDYLETKREQLPAGIEIAYWRDRSQYVKLRLQTLLKSAFQGGILIFLLLTLFLRFSVAVWVSVGIPISFLGALALMPHLGVTFNLVSLFAFILVLGIVVDDAIVTGENIFSKLKDSNDSTDAAIKGTQEIAVPVTFGVLTTVAAFIPLFMMGGDRGPMFAQIPLIVIPVLLFSLVESKLILPAHMKHVRLDSGKPLGLLQRIQRRIADGLENGVRKYYRPLLSWALSWRYLMLTIFITALLIILGIVLSGRYHYTFFPRIQSETAKATLQMPQGTPVEVTANHLQHITEKAKQLREKYTDESSGESVIKQIMTTVGQAGSGRSASTGKSHMGRVSFEIVAPQQRKSNVTSSQLVREWRKMIGTIPGAQEVTYKAEIGHAGEPIDVQLEGQDFEVLKSAAEKIREHLSEFPGVFDIRDSFEGGKEEIKLQIKPAAEQLGLNLKLLGDQVRHAFFGREAQRIQRDRDDIRVMVRYPLEERRSVSNLESMYIRTPDGVEVPFSAVADAEVGRGFATIQRVDRKRTINVTADINKESTNINKITADLGKFVPELLKNYPGVRYSLEGEQREQEESMRSLKTGVIFVLFVIYSLLAIPFRSYVQPLIVMGVIPFSLVGAILGHMIMGMNLSVMSLMGMLALMGVVVNDSLVLVDYINRRRREGIDLHTAISKAGVARFRPILLTSLTTFVGLTPLIMEKSTQAQFLIPMAISLGFGILFATLVTLLLVPVSYLILEDLRGLVSGKQKTTTTLA
jgi:multidrug efflux pump subunit AcrB